MQFSCRTSFTRISIALPLLWGYLGCAAPRQSRVPATSQRPPGLVTSQRPLGSATSQRPRPSATEPSTRVPVKSRLGNYVVFTKARLFGAGGPSGSGLVVLGFVKVGTEFTVVDEYNRDFVRAHFDIDGKMEVWALLKKSVLGRYTLRPRRIPNTQVYVGKGNLVRVLSLRPGSSTKVEATVLLPAGSQPLRSAGQVSGRLFTVQGLLPSVELSAKEPEGPTKLGTVGFTQKNHDLVIFDQPNGRAIWRIPGNRWGRAVRLLETRKNWKRILIGNGPILNGPFLMGWTKTPIDTHTVGGIFGALLRGPLEALVRGTGSLWKVPPGTVVWSFDKKVALLHAQGWAREIRRSKDGKMVLVKLVVNDAMTIYGWIPAAHLTPACITHRGFECGATRGAHGSPGRHP